MTRIVAAVAVLALAGVACPGPSTPEGRITIQGRYVALGDSFSAGEGVLPFETGTDLCGHDYSSHVCTSPTPFPGTDIPHVDVCHRSDHAYPWQVARAVLPDPQGGESFEFLACSGALIQNFYRPNQESPGEHGWYSEAPQLDALGLQASGTGGDETYPSVPGTGPVSLVTLSISGNNIGFSDIILACLYTNPGNATKLGPVDFPGSNKRYDPAKCDDLIHHTVPERIDSLLSGGTNDCPDPRSAPDQPSIQLQPCTLPNLFSDIRFLAPAARVVVVGYPNPLPPPRPGSCTGQAKTEEGERVTGPLWIGRDWEVGLPSLGPISIVASKLNATIRQAVDGAGPGFDFVDPNANGAFTGHEACSDHPYFNGAVVKSQDDHHASAFSFHPNLLGQDELGDAIIRDLKIHPLTATEISGGRPVSAPSAGPAGPSPSSLQGEAHVAIAGSERGTYMLTWNGGSRIIQPLGNVELSWIGPTSGGLAWELTISTCGVFTGTRETSTAACSPAVGLDLWRDRSDPIPEQRFNTSDITLKRGCSVSIDQIDRDGARGSVSCPKLNDAFSENTIVFDADFWVARGAVTPLP